MTKVIEIYCCNCNKQIKAKLVSGDIIYPHRKDLSTLSFYQCGCGCYVGTHKGFKDYPKPLGTIPTKELRNARCYIHAIIDPLYKDKTISRTKLYKKISEKIGWNYHTAMIRNIDEARLIYRAVKQIKSGIEKAITGDK